MARLRVKQEQAATACGVERRGLAKWLCGIDTHWPAVVEVWCSDDAVAHAEQDRATRWGLSS